MRQFFKQVLATITGLFLFNILLIIIVIGVVSSIIATNGSNKSDTISDNSILHLSFKTKIDERQSENGIPSELLGDEKSISLKNIIDAVEKAGQDSKIKGIYLDLQEFQGQGFSSSIELRTALSNFKKTKKPIIAYSEIYTRGSYYLGSVADETLIYPTGLIQFNGFNFKNMYFSEALNKLGIEVKLIRVGKYKSAGEAFIRSSMSDENRFQMTELINSIYSTYLEGISNSKNISMDSLKLIADELLVKDPSDALKYRLVDGLIYPDQLTTRLNKLTKQKSDDKTRFVSISNYINTIHRKSASDKIAIVYANGEILSGQGDDNRIGSDRISKAIRKARLDSKVKAIVLRVNSPGGSALASDVIWREMVLARKAKTVVVSMGDYAASGGYYIAAPAHKIIAQSGTITGSIGVFGLVPNAKKLLNDKLGLYFDGVKTSKYADLGDITRPMTAQEELIIQQGVNNIYDDFVSKVAIGRNLSKDVVYDLAQGRVYTGKTALELKLVDKIGGLNTAILEAAKLAKISSYEIKELPSTINPFDKIMESLSTKAATMFQSPEKILIESKIKEIQNAFGKDKIRAQLTFDKFILD